MNPLRVTTGVSDADGTPERAGYEAQVREVVVGDPSVEDDVAVPVVRPAPDSPTSSPRKVPQPCTVIHRLACGSPNRGEVERWV